MDSPLFCSIEPTEDGNTTRSPSPDILDFDDGETIGSRDTDSHTGTGRPSERPSTPPRFRFAGRYLLLTYSQVPPGFDPLDIAKLFRRRGENYVIARESHQDGGTHYHAFVDYGKVRDVRNPRKWDVHSVHPNLRDIRRTPHRAYAYAVKGRSIVAETFDDRTRPTAGRRDGKALSVGKRNWKSITDAATKDQFFETLKELDPRALVTAFGNVQRYSNWTYGEPRQPYTNPNGLAMQLGEYPDLREYLSGFLNQQGR